MFQNEEVIHRMGKVTNSKNKSSAVASPGEQLIIKGL